MMRLLDAARRTRWIALAVVNLRFLIGFAFLPAALKKLLDQPFTDPTNHGRFHDFLHAFHATGWFYQFVGALQLLAAVLLCTQRFALLGAFVALPILTAITAFCWSTQVYPTATVATLMWLGTVGLLVWELERWLAVVWPDARRAAPMPQAPLDLTLWTRCGIAILVLYLGSVVVNGGVYRPRGVELGNPSFYVLPLVLLMPIITLVLDRRRAR